ncbi:hypothetical protein NQZ68_020593 [Dissostichus eleginoides]|nr:hypothetical protein NQZ68_020593 [Dissostichus eleginoides]
MSAEAATNPTLPSRDPDRGSVLCAPRYGGTENTPTCFNQSFRLHKVNPVVLRTHPNSAEPVPWFAVIELWVALDRIQLRPPHCLEKRGTQPREFLPGDKVLVLVPTTDHKFLASWQGPPMDRMGGRGGRGMGGQPGGKKVRRDHRQERSQRP